MSSQSSDPSAVLEMGRAERGYREAFDRLKRNVPERLPTGTAVSQNNVAKEAGQDPSALKKARYPTLVREIKLWVEEHGAEQPISRRQQLLGARSRNRSLKETMQTLIAERDHAQSLLIEADRVIVSLTHENAKLRKSLPEGDGKVTPLRVMK